MNWQGGGGGAGEGDGVLIARESQVNPGKTAIQSCFHQSNRQKR